MVYIVILRQEVKVKCCFLQIIIKIRYALAVIMIDKIVEQVWVTERKDLAFNFIQSFDIVELVVSYFVEHYGISDIEHIIKVVFEACKLPIFNCTCYCDSFSR